MKALITGGAGFIGSHLTDLLLAQGHSATVVDNLVTGQATNLRHLQGHPRLELVNDTVHNEKRMQALIPQHDAVFHLAAAVGVRWIIDNPLLAIHTNIRATEIVLEAAARFGTKVLIASSSEVYGKNSKPGLREDDDSIIGSTQITRWLYANSKALNEFLALAYNRERSLPVVIVRFFNAVGPRQTWRFGMVVPRLVRQALHNEPITIYGDGEQIRCFTDVQDAVRAVVGLVQLPEAVGEVFNIGNPQPITIHGLAELIVAMTGSRSELRFLPQSETHLTGFEEIRHRVPCVEKLRSYLGWAPSTPLEQSLERIIHYMRTEAAALSQLDGSVPTLSPEPVAGGCHNAPAPV